MAASLQRARIVREGRIIAIVSSAVIEPRANRKSRSARHNIPADMHSIASAEGLWFCEDLVWEKPEGSAVNRSQRFSVDRKPMMWRANANTERIGIYQVPTGVLNDHLIAEYETRGIHHRVEGSFDRGEIFKINPSSASLSGHPALFPLEIPRRLIRYYTWPGDTVYDPFCGSGTTLLAAREMGRRAIGVEKNVEYCELAARRLAQLPLFD